MGTLLRLPETLQGPSEPQGNWRALRCAGNLPANVHLLGVCGDDLPLPEPRPCSPEGYVLLALIETLETRKGFHRIGEDTFQTICAMLKRWGDDPEVREAMHPTLDLLCARQTGRY